MSNKIYKDLAARFANPEEEIERLQRYGALVAHVEKALRLLEQGYEPAWAKVELREAILILKGISK